MIDIAVVAATSPLTVVTRGAVTPVPADLPASPSITVSVNDRVLVTFVEGALIILARLS